MQRERKKHRLQSEIQSRQNATLFMIAVMNGAKNLNLSSFFRFFVFHFLTRENISS